MALDRIVYWRDQRPTYDEVVRVVRNALGGIGEIEEQVDGRMPWICASLPGKPTPMLLGIAPNIPEDLCSSERWFEVYLHDHCVNVLTRMQDEFTNAVAGAVAATLKRYWDGADEPPAETRSA